MKSHRTDNVSLFFGLIFLLVAGGFIARRFVSIDLPDLGWFIAGGLIILGVIGVVSAVIGNRKPAEPAQLAQDDHQAADSTN
jgi:hypothetical protein